MYKQKRDKAQSEIITTVLIILLVLAAIVIVWQVVRSTVTTGAGQITGGTDCITLSLELEDVIMNSTGTYFKVKRNAGAGDLDRIVIIIDGKVNETDIDASGLKELGRTSEKFYAIPSASKIEIAPKLSVDSNSKLCNVIDHSP